MTFDFRQTKHLLFSLFFHNLNSQKVCRLYIYLILTFATIMNSYGQFVSGKIVYQIQPINFDLKSQSAKINSMTEKMYEAAHEQSFTLEFNKEKSSFKQNKFLVTSTTTDKYTTSMNNLASMLVTSDFNYYLNLITKTTILEKKDGVLIKNEYQTKDWEITKESKQIGNYLCYKAIYIKNYLGRNGKEISIPITAWFAPSLPFTYGPKDYNGLPGLILELQERKTIYNATSINLSQEKELKIEFPKGKTITEAEYAKKVMSN
ncbi:GLPGLI family protein [Flavobacterium sp. CHNK8]|uniref:GLPGLI family protein n=1 Tax=Flavobacterium sp. CHNK8 TaxID=2871165 RepID=UPI00210515D0|nr:GLPGLI family protein [Flavobacterium sp. CHNK8]